jgi:DNA primase
MTTRLSEQLLRSLRNDILIDDVIQLYLDIPTKRREGALRFVCPLCREMNTATNPKTNLARCFTCSKNFNPIDIVIAARKCTFTQAVHQLQSTQARRAKQHAAISTIISGLFQKP